MKFDTQRALAAYLGVSEAAIVKWKKAGMPFLMEGMQPKFELQMVLEWLCKRSPRHKAYVKALYEKIKREQEIQKKADKE